ncbi:imidazole glycerol phosphate synthase subunit HisH [candidate division WOR-3 bacterium]|nr:imidazole glycerol phosphate synthase subunit HisH [candidate division WOR-3 bacterium]
MIGIIDYGAGNLLSVKKAFDHLEIDACLVRRKRDCCGVERLVLPGVGAFGSAITALQTSGLYDAVAEWLELQKPFLGICLGLHVLCTGSSETNNVPGFNRIPCVVERFTRHKVPQIGWNQVKKIRSSLLLHNIPDNAFFYFLHGFYVPLLDKVTTAKTDYGIEYTSVIEQDGLCAVQFHPEKSGNAGLALLHNWVELC